MLTSVYVVIIGGAIVEIMRKAGPARTIICAACEGTDVVPMDSPKAQRQMAAVASEPLSTK